ncbi:hypothetical protein BKA70DRAFT_1416387 [Coprinopsis sp. MPI-PUGE-AT-0042]|nr:hypothetical protein BKA70DRAFT_1416387 [Coprinopsis sp. MPI-PUGE-AT-0042]
MFEEICIVCGRQLQEDGRAYCSDNCQASDHASPSVSSSSSALSSPQLAFTPGGDVPALMPSALGSALRKVQQPYFARPSITTSKIRAYGDDEDDIYGSESDLPEDVLFHGTSKSANFIYAMPSALSYARRPSGTNTHSTVPQVHQRNNSSSSPVPPRTRGKDCGGSRSATSRRSQYSTTDEDADLSDCSLSSRPDDVDSDKDQSTYSEITSAKVRRTRNRTSLPACFSLLQINSGAPSKEVSAKTSPVSPSSATTLAHPSPPTPRRFHHENHITRTAFHPSPLHPAVDLNAPRGRQRFSDRSRSSRRSSPSRSHSRHVFRVESPRRNDVRFDDQEGQLFDTNAPRGRTAARRESSPLRLEDAGILEGDRSKSHSKGGSRRGRVSVDELEGVGSFALAPGYGVGRSGLMDRERFAALRIPL